MNVLSVSQETQKVKFIIKDQTELLEEPSADLFGRFSEIIWKKNIKVNKKCKEIYCHERAFSKDPSFWKQDGGKREICNIYEKIRLSKARWQPGVWEKKRVKKKIWNKRSGTRKYQTQGGNVLQRAHSPDNKIQQRTNLFQNIQSSLNLK